MIAASRTSSSAALWRDGAPGQRRCVATLLHGGISVISPDGSPCSHVPLPDPCVTNLCFGGPAMRTLYVTRSGSGRRIAIDDWPLPGLRLHFNA